MQDAVLRMAADRVGGAGVASCTTVTARSVRRPQIRLTGAVDPIALVPVDEVVVTTLVDSVSDGLLTGDDRATRAPFGSGLVAAPPFEGGRTHAGLRAAHGLSALVRVRPGPTITTLLFHAGVSPDGMTTNAERLGVDLRDVQGAVLSHGHFDHVGGLVGLAARGGLPMTVHPRVWTRRRLLLPGGAGG